MWKNIWNNLKISSLIIGGIIGSGIFFLPYTLGTFGFFSIITFLITAMFFLILSIFFSKIEGSPFLFIKNQLGENIAFFVSWSYWFVSWFSSIVVINEIATVLTELIPLSGTVISFTALACLIFINFFGNKNSLTVEVVLSSIKIIPLLLIPILYFIYTPMNNIVVETFHAKQLLLSVPAAVWCFGGVESLSIINSENSKIKNITSVVILTFLIVVGIYCLNILAVWYSSGILCLPTVYGIVMSKLFGSKMGKIIQIIIAIEGISNLNTWILSSSICGYDNSQNGFFPEIFKKKNSFGTAYWSLILSTIGLFPLCWIVRNTDLGRSILTFTDISCALWFLFYFAFLVSYTKKKPSFISISTTIVFGLLTIYLCSNWVCLVIIALGLPFWLRKKI